MPMMLGLAMAAAVTFTAGPAPRDLSTNKPSAEACAAARLQNRQLPGCDYAAALSGASQNVRGQPQNDRPAEPRREPR